MKFKPVTAMAVVLFAASACSSAAATPTAAPAATPAATAAATATQAASAAGKTYKIVLIEGVKSSGFYAAMACGAAAEAKKLGGVDFSATAPDTFSATAETPIVEAVISQHPDAVLVVPTDSTAMAAPIKAMQDAGIKVVLVDTILNDTTIGVSRVASDNVAGGKTAADTLAKLIGSTGSVYSESDKPGGSATDQRVQGFDTQIKTYANIKNIGVQYYKDDSALAASIVTSELSAHPDLAGIFAVDYRATEGIDTGLRTAGKQGKVKVVGFDADPADITALQNGVVDALIVQKPLLIGQTGIDQAFNSLTGKTVQANVATDFVVATKANMTDPSISQFFYQGC
jgi:ribose transport system substrate-binding protein